MMLSFASTIAAFLCLLYIIFRRKSFRYPLMRDYPILGMLPALLWNLWRIHDFLTEVVKQHGRTGEFMGPWFTKMNFMLTSDPVNVRHIMITNFQNYVKGREFREFFRAFGGAIVTTDSHQWEKSRSLVRPSIMHRSFELFYQQTTQKKVQSALLPLFHHFQKQGTVVDLQDVFSRFTFDNICSTILGFDPASLSVHFPELEYEK